MRIGGFEARTTTCGAVDALLVEHYGFARWIVKRAKTLRALRETAGRAGGGLRHPRMAAT